MKAPLLIASLLYAAGTPAAVLTWPGPAPCDGTIGSCVFAAASGDTVRIATNTLPGGAVILNKSLTLEAAPGYLPQVAEDDIVLINATDGGNYTVTVRGLRFPRGQIQAYHSSGDFTIIIERNRFDASLGSEPSIWLLADSDIPGADFDYVIRYNHIYDSTPLSLGTLRVSGTGAGNGWVRGDIVGNTIRARGAQARGIVVFESQGSPHQADIFGNTIEGPGGAGIEVTNNTGGAGGNMSVNIYSNLVFNPPSGNLDGEGIALWSAGNPITGHIVNNTVIHQDYGLAFRIGVGGSLNATVANNLVANNFSAWLIPGAATIAERHNLVFNNDIPPGSLDPTTITADPLLDPTLPGRLRGGSPAIDSGDNGSTGGFPALDARGNRRYIGAGVDIGAVEFGDRWLLARNPGSGSNNFAIDNPALNGQPGLVPQVTAVWNPHGTAAGIYNDGNEGLYYFDERWRVFNQGLLSDTIAQDASFALFIPGSNLQVGTHNNSTDTSTTTIDWPAANDHPERILAVSQHWNRDGSPNYNDHAIGVFYAFGFWRIANLDNVEIPVGADFNLFTQDPSQNAYEHIARGANRVLNWTYLQHPLLDGNPCARMQVTQSAGQGVFNDHPIGVFYANPQWAIFNQDGVTMPENAAFHVIVDGNSASCALFSDSFE